MERTWRWFGKKDKITLAQLKQIGVEGIVTALHDVPLGEVWTREKIHELKEYIESYGMKWSVVESLPVVETLKYGGPDRDHQIEVYKESLRNLGEEGIKCICYNFMPVLDWARTDLSHDNPNGANNLYMNWGEFAYFDIYILQREGAREDWAEFSKEHKWGRDLVAEADEIKKTSTPEQDHALVENIIIKTQGFVSGNFSEGDSAPVQKFRDLLKLYDGILIVYIAVVLFRSVQRSFGYNLTDQWRRETGLAELHHRLADFCILGDEGTHTDTALTVTLRNRIDENRVLLDAFQVHRTDIRTAGIDILTVNLIREEIEVVLLHQVTNLIHLSAGIEIARRVVRVADQNGTGALIDQLLKLLHLRQGETFFYRCGDGTDLGTRRDGKRHIVSVSRFWYDNLVARVEAAHEREEYSLRTSRCNDDIIGSYVDVEFLIVIYKLLAIAEIALTWRILQDRAVYMLQGI